MPLAPGTLWFDTARPDAENASDLVFLNPIAVLQALTPDDVLPVLREAVRWQQRGFWVAGALAYEAGLPLMHLDGPLPNRPLVWFGVYEAPTTVEDLPPPDTHPAVTDVFPDVSREAYARQIDRLRRWIFEGDVYQINHTFDLHVRTEGSPLDLYRALRMQQPVPYGAFLHLDGQSILSLSPELFFRTSGRTIWTRPMKGTMPRTEAETFGVRALAEDPKNRAENLMIVDLLRNDLSRVAEWGSVQVTDLFAVELHPTVAQMTSTIRATLRPEVDAADLFQALFPCGSITGAPKHRAMQCISLLEERPRGWYCGALGFLAPNGDAVFNVAIRTLVFDETGQGTLGVGSGVVWDSNPEAEYAECLLKARFLGGIQGVSASRTAPAS